MARKLITSALPYINGVKHLGNLVGSMLPADIYARYLRLQGHEVAFICATDEHGTPAELAAAEAGLEVAEYCAQQHERQRDIYRLYGLTFDYFGRTSSPRNHLLTQEFAIRLREKGLLETRETLQPYSEEERRFLPDRYVIGTCPVCGFEDARGDQCDNCGSLLDPADLTNLRSVVSGSSRIELRRTKHLFFRLDLMEPAVRSWLESKPDWPLLTRSIGMKWLDEGLQPRSITRDLSWGVEVPWDGFEGKVFYVWFDAPIDYLSSTAAWAEAHGNQEWESWWKDDDVSYTQFMAKDNVPFHTVFFPATLLGADQGWRLPDFIKGFNWLTFYGDKFSTSRHHGVFLDDALELRPADCWRWYLIANAPESNDATFTFDRFAEAINADLANTLGNFVNRTLSFTEKHFGSIVPEGGAPGPEEEALHAELVERAGDYSALLEAMEFRKASAALRDLWSLGNRYLETTGPWRVLKVDRDRAAVALRTAINLLHHIARLSSPIIPVASASIAEAVGRHDPTWPSTADDLTLDVLPRGSTILVPPLLFSKVTTEELDAWVQRFASGLAAD